MIYAEYITQNIKVKPTMLKSSPRDYSDAYTLFKSITKTLLEREQMQQQEQEIKQ